MSGTQPSASHREIAGELAAIGEALRRITVAVRNGSGSHGSGVIWSPDGLIVTNAHVVSGREPTVELSTGRTLQARLIRRDPMRDLAALEVRAEGLPAAQPAPSKGLRPGTLVVALGHPFGVPGALSLGVLHAGVLPGVAGDGRWLRADVRLAPGNSGGPLADAGGRVLGLNTMIVSGLAYAIPSPIVTRFASGQALRAALGITIRPVALRGRRGGVGYVVLEVAPGGAAAEAGLTAGDVITAIGGQRFTYPGALAAVLDEANPGDRLEIEIVRGYERHIRPVVLRPVPARPRAA